jgi:hypothetical protein
MPIILASQEIRRIVVQSQPQAKSSRDPILKKPITHTHTHPHTGGVAQGIGTEFKPQYQIKKKKRTGFSSKVALSPATWEAKAGGLLDPRTSTDPGACWRLTFVIPAT